VVLLEPIQQLIKQLQDCTQGADTLQHLVKAIKDKLISRFTTAIAAISGKEFEPFNKLIACHEDHALKIGMYLQCHSG
jgi:nucleosome binding factor SPN SPT16 subunit